MYSAYAGYNNYKTYSPYLIDGITDATVPQKFSAYQIKPSSDSQYGTEFTYSFWIFIKDTNFSNNTFFKVQIPTFKLVVPFAIN